MTTYDRVATLAVAGAIVLMVLLVAALFIAMFRGCS